MMYKVETSPGTPWLVAAAWMSVAAALAHLACIIGGPDWFRFMGAPEPLIRAYENGNDRLVYITIFIGAILAGWGLWAFSAAGWIIRLPLLNTALFLIAAVLLIRAAMIFFPGFWDPQHSGSFRIWTSGICLAMGLCFAIGLWRGWPSLGKRKQP
ncbi:hypothetical protein ACFOWX_01145 [Sphingorhabdus arenilitoris]|uniref:Uncharacterized protein n=1 Tax=Sphingorhabdus arenilitoris TaxID=1490041 RepID=A0ABV8RDS0_9SPHN